MGVSPEARKGKRAMQEIGVRRELPELKALVIEASRALARLDADRLDELAVSCQALNRDLVPLSPEEREALARESREATGDMAVFARVLEATRANLAVMNRLRELRAGRLEYGERPLQTRLGTGGSNGDN
jgi:aminopeptidase N